MPGPYTTVPLNAARSDQDRRNAQLREWYIDTDGARNAEQAAGTTGSQGTNAGRPAPREVARLPRRPDVHPRPPTHDRVPEIDQRAVGVADVLFVNATGCLRLLRVGTELDVTVAVS